MAHTADDNLVHVSFPIQKFEEDSDGNLIVTGTVTDGSVDSDRQIVDPGWSGKALQAWMESGPNVRVMHSAALYPAGRGLQVELGDNTHTLKALVVEETAKKLVRNKVLRAYSIGVANPVIKRDPTGKAPGGIVVGGDMAEVSLVDRPANKNCQLTLAKSVGSDTPWTYGDLDALLAKAEKEAEADLTKHPEDDAEDGKGADDGVVDFGDGGHPDDDSAPSASADVDDHEDGDVKKYAAAVREHRAAEPTRDGAALNGTDFLRKAAAWQHWATVGEDTGLDGSADGMARWLAKRDFDPAVGGGVDRDKLSASDFVDSEGRRFPVVKPGDVSDAVSSYGRAKPQIPMDTFKARLKSIAERKGAAFVAELPEGWKAVTADLGKDITLTSPDPDGLVPYNLAGGTVKGSGGKSCIRCGKSYHADAKVRRCEGCGKKLPKGDMGKISKGAKHLMPPGVAGPGHHREPDGDQVELFEHDAGMHTDPDDGHDRMPGSMKGGGEAYVVKRTHDALCAAYDWDTVTDEYPALKGVAEVVDSGWWEDQIPDALAKGDMTGVAFLAGVAHTAGQLLDAQPWLLDDVRAGVRKSFADMYPTASLHPGTITPGQFTRPYLTQGRASENAASRGPAQAPPAPHGITPGQFDRGLITAGHEAESPSDGSGNNPTGDVGTGAARRLYAMASKAATENALKSMHDQLATTFPDMCPMATSRDVMPADMHLNARPMPTALPGGWTAPGEKAELAALVKAAEKAARKAEKAAAQASAEMLFKSADTTAASHYETTIAALQAQIDELSAQPDPTQAPLRGAVTKAATSEPAPVEKRSLLVEAQEATAAAEAAEWVGYLRMMAKSANPATREEAEERLALLTKTA